MAQMPTPRSRLALVAYGGRLYAIGGETAMGVSDEVDVYLPDADDWVRGPDKPTAVANVSATAWEAKVYVPGGSLASGAMSDRLEILDLDSASWHVGQALPYGLCAYASVAYQGQIYLFGGWDGVSYLSQSFRYDPSTDAWERRSPMPTSRAFAGAGVIGEYIYVVGGYDGENELDLCQVYDPQADVWAKCPPMNAPRGGLNVAVIADTLYAIGGGWNSYLVENERFSLEAADPTQGTWQTFPSPMLQEWRNLGVVSSDATLYAIGGWDGGYLGVNQAYRVLYRLYLPSAMGAGSGTVE
jgi:N-acetylneuraminic acid mutarotase